MLPALIFKYLYNSIIVLFRPWKFILCWKGFLLYCHTIYTSYKEDRCLFIIILSGAKSLRNYDLDTPTFTALGETNPMVKSVVKKDCEYCSLFRYVKHSASEFFASERQQGVSVERDLRVLSDVSSLALL